MKTIVKLAGMGLLTMFLYCGNAPGQEQTSAPAKVNGKGSISIFSAQQKEMLKHRALKTQAFRKEFKASISQKQKDILSDPRVMPYERRKSFRASLTDQQVSMIKTFREDLKKMREDFRATLTPDQKAALKKRAYERRMKFGPKFRDGLEGTPEFMK